MNQVLKDSINLDMKHLREEIFLPNSSAKYHLTPHLPFKITSMN